MNRNENRNLQRNRNSCKAQRQNKTTKNSSIFILFFDLNSRVIDRCKQKYIRQKRKEKQNKKKIV